jgi:hypothetical protein
MFHYERYDIHFLEISHDGMVFSSNDEFGYSFATSKDDNPDWTESIVNDELYHKLCIIFGSIVLWYHKGFVSLALYPSNDGISIGTLWYGDDDVYDAVGKFDKELVNINNYVFDYEEAIITKKIASMVCIRQSTKKQDFWICEVSFESTVKKSWFYMQDETNIAWAIMIVFACRDKTELRIEIDEKTGEILDIFMFSPIVGISI